MKLVKSNSNSKKYLQWQAYGLSCCFDVETKTFHMYNITGKVLDEELDEYLLELHDYMQSNPSSFLLKTTQVMGADPEIFMLDKDSNVVPAYKVLPDQIKNDGKAMSLYNDGFQAEFSFLPNTCHAYIMDSIHSALKAMVALPGVAKLSLATTVQIPQEVMDATPDKYAQFGCTPSINAYGMGGEMLDGRATLFRSSGGHIHFSLPERCKNKDFYDNAAKQLDRIVGVIGVSLFGKIDNPERRKSYGLAGEYRTPSYGMEYRTLSSAWLCHPFIAQFILGMARTTIQSSDVGVIDALFEGSDEDVINCINNNDQDLAREIIANNERLIKAILNKSFHMNVEKVDDMFQLILEDVTTWIKDPSDIKTNWLLNPGDQYRTHANDTKFSIQEFARML